jgi:hypothetical protein
MAPRAVSNSTLAGPSSLCQSSAGTVHGEKKMLSTLDRLEDIASASAGAWYDLWFGEVYRDVRVTLADEDEERRAACVDRVLKSHLHLRGGLLWSRDPGGFRPRSIDASGARNTWILILLGNGRVAPTPQAISRSSPSTTASNYWSLLALAAFTIVRAEVERLLETTPVEVCNDDH